MGLLEKGMRAIEKADKIVSKKVEEKEEKKGEENKDKEPVEE